MAVSTSIGLVFVPDPGHCWAAYQPGMAHWEEVVLPRGILGTGQMKMHRCNVPSGWVVLTGGNHPSLLFYPDPEHRWSEDAATELEAASAPEGTGTELMRE